MVLCIIKSIRIRCRIFKDIILTALVSKNQYGITKWGVSLNTGILLRPLSPSEEAVSEKEHMRGKSTIASESELHSVKNDR